MVHKLKIISLFIIFLFALIALSPLSAQEKQEVVLTISAAKSGEKMDAFNRAEALRRDQKFAEAMAEYQKVIQLGETCGKEAEAHYDIGICLIWLSKKDDAEAVFNEVLKRYPDNKEVMAYTKYCQSWIDVQRGGYEPAIARLQETLNQKTWTDEAFCSRALFQIGRIYLSFMQNRTSAEAVFSQVLAKYPDAEITNHPFLDNLKNGMSVN